jgi:hypothetical protein
MLTLKEKVHLVNLRSLQYTYDELNKKGYTNKVIADTMRQGSLIEIILELEEENERLQDADFPFATMVFAISGWITA